MASLEIPEDLDLTNLTDKRIMIYLKVSKNIQKTDIFFKIILYIKF